MEDGETAKIVGKFIEVKSVDEKGQPFLTKKDKNPYMKIFFKGDEEAAGWWYNYFGKTDIQSGAVGSLTYELKGKYRNIKEIEKQGTALSPETIRKDGLLMEQKNTNALLQSILDVVTDIRNTTGTGAR